MTLTSKAMLVRASNVTSQTVDITAELVIAIVAAASGGQGDTGRAFEPAHDGALSTGTNLAIKQIQNDVATVIAFMPFVVAIIEGNACYFSLLQKKGKDKDRASYIYKTDGW